MKKKQQQPQKVIIKIECVITYCVRVRGIKNESENSQSHTTAYGASGSHFVRALSLYLSFCLCLAFIIVIFFVVSCLYFLCAFRIVVIVNTIVVGDDFFCSSFTHFTLYFLCSYHCARYPFFFNLKSNLVSRTLFFSHSTGFAFAHNDCRRQSYVLNICAPHLW